MPKSITDQIEDLQNENLRLKEFEKLFDKAVKKTFGIDSRSIRKRLSKGAENTSEFERKICHYFDINTDEEKTAFLEILCNDENLRYVMKYVPVTQQG